MPSAPIITQKDVDTMSMAIFKIKNSDSDQDGRRHQRKTETMGVGDFLDTFLARKKYHAAGTVGCQNRPSFHKKKSPRLIPKMDPEKFRSPH
jgi:hypothetical protein